MNRAANEEAKPFREGPGLADIPANWVPDRKASFSAGLRLPNSG